MTTTPENPENGLVEAQSIDNQVTSQRSADEVGHYLESDHKYSVQTDRARSAQVMVYFLQAIARELMPDQRVAWCMRRFQPYRQTVDIVHSPQRQAAYYLGLMRCSLIWMCPVCARKISETRRRELDALIEANKIPVLKRDGKTVFMVPRYHLSMLTFTIAHEWEESAAQVLDRLSRAYARWASGRWYQGFKQTYFVVGTLRALEMTHGEHGWHPHYHLLVWHDSYLPPGKYYGKADEDDAALIQEYTMLGITREDYIQSARLRWTSVVHDIGGKTDIVRGVDLVYGNTHKYAVKLAGDAEARDWGLVAETTKAVVKHARNGNRSLTDLLISYSRGDVQAGELWIEAVHALKRQKHLHPSKGLWAMLGRGVSEDETAAEDTPEVTDRILASLNWLQWQMIIRNDARGEVLDVASRGDENELWAYLAGFGIEQEETPGEETNAPYLD